jgi:hypothetical protein
MHSFFRKYSRIGLVVNTHRLFVNKKPVPLSGKISLLCSRSIAMYTMRNVSLLIVLASIALAVSSCKPREKCPAYGHVQVTEQQSAS